MRARGHRGVRASGKQNTIIVADDWPEIVPITEAELRVIEAHFGDFLGEVLGPKA